MKQASRRPDDGPRRATNVSLGEALIAEAKALGVNVSRACEEGLERAVRLERAERWQADNAAGFDAWNAYVRKNGIPLAAHRKF